MKTLLLTMLAVGLYQLGIAQQQDYCYDLRVSVQDVRIGPDMVEFDVYLRSGKARGDACGLIMLGHADFVVGLNGAAFADPVVEKLGDPLRGGSCTFKPLSGSEMQTLLTRALYFNAISPRIVNGDVVINVQPPAVGDMQGYENNLAAIDDGVREHRLARFRVTGYRGHGNPGLAVVRMQGKKPVVRVGDRLVRELPSVAHSYRAGAGFRSLAVSVRQDGPFSLEIKNFTATPKDGVHSQLLWVTAWEEDVQQYVIQRSAEGERWEDIGAVEAKGMSANTIQDYLYGDLDVYDGERLYAQYYYRLKIVDGQDQIRYSNVEKVDFRGQGLQLEARAYPNPSTEGLHLELRRGETEQADQMLLYDVSGKVVFQREISPESTYEYIDYSRAGIETGAYFVQLRDTEVVYWHEKIEIMR